LGDGRAALVDLRVLAAGRVEHDGVRPRLLADPPEVVEDRFVRQRLDDPRARRPAREPCRDHGTTEALDRPRDVDALATRHRRLLDRPMTAPEPEVRHLQRLIDCRVEGDRDDHAALPMSARRCRRRLRRTTWRRRATSAATSTMATST